MSAIRTTPWTACSFCIFCEDGEPCAFHQGQKRKDKLMQLGVIKRVEYDTKYGPPSATRGMTPEVMNLWQSLQKLPETDCQIIAAEKGEDLADLRRSLSMRIKRMAKATRSPVTYNFALNKAAKHVVIWKSPAVNGKGKATR